jgi:hypothetical protein
MLHSHLQNKSVLFHCLFVFCVEDLGIPKFQKVEESSENSKKFFQTISLSFVLNSCLRKNALGWKDLLVYSITKYKHMKENIFS